MPSLTQAVLTAKLQRFLSEEISAEFAESVNLPHVDFARLKMAGNTKQKKNCSKNSFACGYSCQPRFTKSGKETQCRSPLPDQAKTYAEALAKQIKTENNKGVDVKDSKGYSKESSSSKEQPKMTTEPKKFFFESEEFISSLSSSKISLPELEGSEKQIAWAQEIRQRWLDEFDQLIKAFNTKAEDLKSQGKSTDRLVENLGQNTVNFIRAISSTSSAQSFIKQKDVFIYQKGKAVTLNNLYAPFGFLQASKVKMGDFKDIYNA